jgi:hypothetical protein
MHDVLYFDRSHQGSVLGSGLSLEAACELARAEAQKRRTGRMFMTGSDPNTLSDIVVIVETAAVAAPAQTA